MSKAYILAAGKGRKIWPYGELRNKAMIPVANKPVVNFLVESLTDAGISEILIGTSMGSGELRKNFRNNGIVKIIDTGTTSGTAHTAQKIFESNLDETGEGFFIFYGDTLIGSEDLSRFVKDVNLQLQKKRNVFHALLTPLEEERTGDYICCSTDKSLVENILGHPREGASHRFSGFFISSDFFNYLKNCGEIFHDIEVGMMPPVEKNLEIAISDYIKDGNQVSYSETIETCIDLDKPWHILLANSYMCKSLTGSLTGNVLAEGASIDDSARISGFVKLGKNSRIGNNVMIKGNLIVGDNSIIENGAIFAGSALVGDDTNISNYCYIDDQSVIGNRCIINHCAEISGTIMDTVYLYHYMEINGLLGEGTDIGAATVCGSLRFDDGITIHKIRGRKEFPVKFSDASYIGDFCRTGVNSIIMPGCKMGPYSILGSGVLLEEDLPSRTSIRVKQELIKGTWGPERYGW